jgi:hypothetical protein
VATEQDAARDRVLAARAELAEQLEVLEASGRAAVDIPARVRRSPAKAAAIVGGAGFLALKGPQRAFRAARQAVTGKPPPMPKRMLPDEIEKTLRKLGDDGEKVRGALERDFADYAKKAEKDRKGVLSVMLLAAARPLLARGAKAAGEYLLSPDAEGFSKRLAQVRSRAEDRIETVKDRASDGIETVKDRASDGIETVKDRASEGVDAAREAAREGAERAKEGADRVKDVAKDRLAAARTDDTASRSAPDEDVATGI